MVSRRAATASICPFWRGPWWYTMAFFSISWRLACHWGAASVDLPLSHLVPPAPTARPLGHPRSSFLSWIHCGKLHAKCMLERIHNDTVDTMINISSYIDYLWAKEWYRKLDVVRFAIFCDQLFKSLSQLLSHTEPCAWMGHVGTSCAIIFEQKTGQPYHSDVFTPRCTGHDKVFVAWQLQGTRPWGSW